MSSNQQQQQQQRRERDVVFCHQCENEWYRDEHGLVCPECHGDFVEVIEENNDPRQDAANPDPFGAFAPDPDEDDIDDFQWRNTGPGQYRGTLHRNVPLQPGQQIPGGLGTGVLGFIGQALGPALQGMLGGQQGQQQQRQQQQQHQEHYSDQPRSPGPEGPHTGAPQSPQMGGGTTTRRGSGPGYSYTITTSTRSGFGPRDANAPQPLQGQPENLERMMTQMLMNIGVPAHAHPPPGQHPLHQAGGGIIFGAPPPGMGGLMGGPMGGQQMGGHVGGLQMGGLAGFGNLIHVFGLPPGGVAGDHVYTQEGLDRIITQLMEQHQAGNAPPPASEEAIESLPRRKVTEKDFGDGGKADCSICMDEAELGSEVTELPCHHWFHHDCIKAWLVEHDTCPHCRQGITPKEGESTGNRPRQPGQAPLHDMHSPDYQRARAPGEYPFPNSNQDSSAAEASGTSNAAGSRRSASPRADHGGGMFSRMREAFSPRDHPPAEQRGDGEGDKHS
ncbi:hypothetical protein CERZMDRAFT_105795 [Cercospora zeae-maydis SCOH1-5]|uniref:RING-type E3 ubiquitin transferase n=1 Tax=Cercospora zeae-maydis SCOH1-5 TaxID=717836 RepID=A0A6A6FHP5_9PEZI|nr:hypothetical protein CERZMDRAFT_105795 [Cercospora zeae-maydis SCOH1-5]